MLNKERLENLSDDIWKGAIKLRGEYKAIEPGSIFTWSPTGKPVVPSIYALWATSRYWDEFWNSSTSKDVVFFLSG